MSELIKREDAIKITWIEPQYSDPINVLTEVRDRIKALPTMDAVKHGEWIPFQRPNGGYYKGCSVCSSPIPTDSMLDYMDEIDNRFCYNCGAKMDGEEQDDG